MAAFSDVLTYLRKREGISQQVLAKRTKLTRSAIGMYETGRREPDFETLEIFADYFNVSMDVLLGKSGNEEAPAVVIDVEGLPEDKRYLIERIMSLSDDEVRGLRAIVDQVLQMRGK